MKLYDKDKTKGFTLDYFRKKGVNIVIDGDSADGSAWPLIIGESSDSSCYMGDFIFDESGTTLQEIRLNRCFPDDKRKRRL